MQKRVNQRIQRKTLEGDNREAKEKQRKKREYQRTKRRRNKRGGRVGKRERGRRCKDNSKKNTITREQATKNKK